MFTVHSRLSQFSRQNLGRFVMTKLQCVFSIILIIVDFKTQGWPSVLTVTRQHTLQSQRKPKQKQLATTQPVTGRTGISTISKLLTDLYGFICQLGHFNTSFIYAYQLKGVYRGTIHHSNSFLEDIRTKVQRPGHNLDISSIFNDSTWCIGFCYNTTLVIPEHKDLPISACLLYEIQKSTENNATIGKSKVWAVVGTKLP